MLDLAPQALPRLLLVTLVEFPQTINKSRHVIGLPLTSRQIGRNTSVVNSAMASSMVILAPAATKGRYVRIFLNLLQVPWVTFIGQAELSRGPRG